MTSPAGSSSGSRSPERTLQSPTMGRTGHSLAGAGSDAGAYGDGSSSGDRGGSSLPKQVANLARVEFADEKRGWRRPTTSNQNNSQFSPAPSVTRPLAGSLSNIMARDQAVAGDGKRWARSGNRSPASLPASRLHSPLSRSPIMRTGSDEGPSLARSSMFGRTGSGGSTSSASGAGFRRIFSGGQLSSSASFREGGGSPQRSPMFQRSPRREMRRGVVLAACDGAAKYTHLQMCTKVCLNREARLVATAGAEGNFKIFTVEEMEVLHDVWIDTLQPKRVSALSFSADGKFLLVGDWGSRVQVYDVRRGVKVLEMPGHDCKVTCGVFEAASKYLLTGGEDKTARMWDPRSPEKPGQVMNVQDAVLDCSMSPCSRHALLALRSGQMHLYDVRKSAEIVKTFEGHGDWVNSCGFSPDGGTAVSASQDKTIRLWDVASGGETAVFGPYAETVNRAKFYGDSAVLACQGNKFWESSTNSVFVIDSGSGDVIHDFETKSAIMCVDGHFNTGTLVSAGADMTARVWEVPTPHRPAKSGAKLESPTGGWHSCKWGCGASLSSALLLGEHQDRQCHLRMVACIKCGEQVAIGEMEVHEQGECAFAVFDCGCGQQVSFAERLRHQDVCGNRDAECDLCGLVVRERELEGHKAKVCQERKVECSKGCGRRVRASEILRHQTTQCAARLLTCEACDEEYVFKDEKLHLERVCPARVVGCRLCGDSIKFMMMIRHEGQECPKRMLLCGKGCGASVPADELQDHEGRTCMLLPAPCDFYGFGCRDIVARKDLAEHVLCCKFSPPPAQSSAAEADISASETQPSSPESPAVIVIDESCSKCKTGRRRCPQCDELFCLKCLNLSGLPTSLGMCKPCTKKQLLKNRRTESKKEIKFQF